MERFEADFIDTNENGTGITRLDGMVVFVPGVLPGERAEIEITERKKNYGAGKCLSLIRRSDHRIASLCPDEDVCGGCSLGWVDFDEENRIKANAVRSALRRAGLGDIPVGETVSSPNRYGYRNKMTVHYDPGAQSCGYCRPESNVVLPCRGCALCPPVFSDIVCCLNDNSALAAALSPESLSIRSADDGVTVILSCRERNERASETIRSALKERFSEISHVLVSAPDHRETAELTDRIAGLDMHYSAEAFRQVNASAFERLLAMVCEEAEKVNFKTAADLYCGSGVIGLTLAKAFPKAKFYGIEINPDAVEDAKKNAARNGIANIRFFCGDSASFRQRFPVSPDLVTVDPPRAGLSSSMRRELLALAPQNVIYVSCNPQTLARDLAEQRNNGYRIASVTPVNMFPATKHIETVASLVREAERRISYEPL